MRCQPRTHLRMLLYPFWISPTYWHTHFIFFTRSLFILLRHYSRRIAKNRRIRSKISDNTLEENRAEASVEERDSNSEDTRETHFRRITVMLIAHRFARNTRIHVHIHTYTYTVQSTRYSGRGVPEKLCAFPKLEILTKRTPSRRQ